MDILFRRYETYAEGVFYSNTNVEKMPKSGFEPVPVA